MIEVVGNDSTFHVGDDVTIGGYTTLKVTIDASTVTKIDIDGDAAIDGTVDVTLSGYTPSSSDTFDILYTDGTITDNGIALDAGDTSAWTLSVVNSDTLRLTYN